MLSLLLKQYVAQPGTHRSKHTLDFTCLYYHGGVVVYIHRGRVGTV